MNRIGIEVIRPPDPTAPSGVGIVLANGDTTVEWLAPAVSLTHTGPALATVGQELTYTITVANSGKVEARSMTVTNPVPPGLQYVRSEPPAVVSGGQLIWTLGRLPPGQAHTIQAVFRTTAVGTVNNCARVVTEENLRDERCAVTVVGQPGLKVSVSAPATGVVNVPVNYQITVANPGTVPLEQASVTVRFDQGLEHGLATNPLAKVVSKDVGTIPPGQSVTLPPLPLVPRVPGRLVTRVTATAAGNLSDQAEHVLLAQQAQLGLSIDGPKKQYVGQTTEWRVQVSNQGAAALPGVQLRYKLPAEMTLQNATPTGKMENGEVVWQLAALPAQGQAEVKLALRGEKASPSALQRVVALAPGLNVTAQASVELSGVPALQLKMVDVGDPVRLKDKIMYEIQVTNTGSLDAGQVEIVATLPPELTPLADGTTGPTKATVVGQQVTFAPLAALPPQQTAKFQVTAVAGKTGDVRMRVELRSKALESPVVEWESSRIYDPGNGPAATPLPPPVAPGLPRPWVIPRPLPAGPKTP